MVTQTERPEERQHHHIQQEEKKIFDGALRRRQLRLVLGGKMKAEDAVELKALFRKD